MMEISNFITGKLYASTASSTF